jgi:hypothetical protein
MKMGNQMIKEEEEHHEEADAKLHNKTASMTSSTGLGKARSQMSIASHVTTATTATTQVPLPLPLSPMINVDNDSHDHLFAEPAGGKEEKPSSKSPGSLLSPAVMSIRPSSTAESNSGSILPRAHSGVTGSLKDLAVALNLEVSGKSPDPSRPNSVGPGTSVADDFLAEMTDILNNIKI